MNFRTNLFLFWSVASATLFFASLVAQSDDGVAHKPAVAKPSESNPGDSAQFRQQALDRVTHDIKHLASDEMGGRQPGTPGIQLAEDYIVSQYEAAGLKQLPDDTWFQTLEVNQQRSVEPGSAKLSLTGPDDQQLDLELGKDYRQLVCRKNFDLDADLVFAGYGISASEHNYNEFDQIDVKGKIVVLLRLEPQNDDDTSVFDGTQHSRHASGRSKATAARRAGAVGVLMVNNIGTAPDDARDMLIQEDRFGTLSLPVAQIKRSVFQQILDTQPLLTPTGKRLKTLEQIENLIDQTLSPISQPIPGWQAKFSANIATRKTKTNNIIGVIEGEGPHADETIIIGAHYDHLGKGAYGSRAPGRKEIHNGADDNATGTAAVMELARRFAQKSEAPQRRLVFICFTAEEMGLLGAFHYIQHPIYPLEKTTAMVNFDMIGWLRNDRLTIYNWNSSPQLARILHGANADEALELVLPNNPFAGSDHLPFHQSRIPNMFLHTGLNDVYHTPEDDFEAIDCDGALKVIDYSEKVIEQLASLDTAPTFGTPRPFRLGVMLEDDDNVVKITRVLENSIAEKSGLNLDDVIVSIDGSAITSRRHVVRIVRRDQGKTINVKIQRGEEEIEIDVTLVKQENE